MTSPLIQRLFDENGYPEITQEGHDAFVGQAGTTVLFFAGDPKRYRDTTDVAVVLPELVKALDGRLHPGVVAQSAEIPLQEYYGFKTWPALVFVRNGGYLGAITGIQNWSDYLQQIAALMDAEPTRPPSFKIPLVSE